LQVLNFKQCKR